MKSQTEYKFATGVYNIIIALPKLLNIPYELPQV